MKRHPSNENRGPVTAPQPLSCVSFDAAEPAGGDAFEQWQEACRPVFEVAPLGDLSAYTVAFKFYEVDGLVFNQARYAATSYHRTARHVRSGAEFFTLQLLLRGREVGESNGSALFMAPDRIVLRDWSRLHHSFSEAAEQVSVIIPRDRILARDRLQEREPAASWSVQSPHGRMLANALISVWRSLPQMNVTDAPALASGLLGLLNGLLSPRPAPTEGKRIQEATLAAMRTFLIQRLWDADLDVDHLLRSFHQTRPTVYRLFKESGGVRAFIQERRLTEILRELNHGGTGSRSVAQVARKWGFSDVTYFHRAFKKRFGVTPGEVVRLSRNAAGSARPGFTSFGVSGNITDLHRWIGSSD